MAEIKESKERKEKEREEQSSNKKISLSIEESIQVGNALKEKLMGELDTINETILVSLGNKDVKVRIREMEETVFQPCVRHSDLNNVMSETEDSTSEEEDRSEGSMDDSPENFSDEEYEGSFGESFVQESSPEETFNDLRNMSAEKYHENMGDEEQRNSKNFVKSNEKKGDDVVEEIQSKAGETSPNGVLNPSYEAQFLGAQKELFKEAQEEDCLYGLKEEDNNKFDPKINNGEDIPEALNGVSDRLKELLKKNTPLKEKITKNTENVKDQNESMKNKNEEAKSVNSSSQEEVYKQVRSIKKKEEGKNRGKRITRRQTRKSRSKESSVDSISTEVNSSNYLLGVADSDQRIEDIGVKCGILKRSGRGNSQLKGIKNGAIKGNQ
ncbi:hypothetical protein L2E82_08612 [Cichorium intybus]|uniref:Uncharacterized protein n=1 Tax=Cichorium intybus TaxID=13427 RepID=A0ACB9G6Q7_CICIN|nr:hypothetical protein L2E82_08612 [Cichorium intybus]